MFKTERLQDGDYECHGCGTYENLKAIKLPNLCNQDLVLCHRCQHELQKTLEKI